jgi:hypothetical protein
MGLHISQNEDIWNLRIKEIWYLDKEKVTEFIDLTNFLIKRLVDFKVTYDFDFVLLRLEEVVINYPSYSAIIDELGFWLNYKKLYGSKQEADKKRKALIA